MLKRLIEPHKALREKYLTPGNLYDVRRYSSHYYELLNDKGGMVTWFKSAFIDPQEPFRIYYCGTEIEVIDNDYFWFFSMENKVHYPKNNSIIMGKIKNNSVGGLVGIDEVSIYFRTQYMISGLNKIYTSINDIRNDTSLTCGEYTIYELNPIHKMKIIPQTTTKVEITDVSR